MTRLTFALLGLLMAAAPQARGQVFQSGGVVPQHLTMWGDNNTAMDAGGSGQAPQGLQPFELGITSAPNASGNPFPATATGHGPNGEDFCLYDSPITSAGHYLCLSPNLGGGNATISTGALGAPPGTLNFLINGVSIPAVPGSVSGLPQAVSNAALQALSSTFATAVVRLDYAVGVGATPTLYRASGSPCPLSGGSGDNGSQVKSADGKCWLAAFPASGADVREWGVVFDGVTDNSTALQSAFSWAAATSGVLRLPAATAQAVFASPVAVTLPTVTSSLSVFGPGHDASVLQYSGASGTAITVNHNATAGKQNSTHWRDFTLCTNHAGGATGIVLVETTPGPGQIAVSDFTNVVLRGCDGYGVTDYWTTAINTQLVSYVNYPGLTVDGGSGPNGVGVLINGSASNFVFIHNFPAINFNNLNVGLQTDQNVQGVTVTSGSNMVNVNFGIVVPTGTGTDQLTVSDSQFNCIVVCIKNAGADLFLNHNYFILSGNSANGIQLIGQNGVTITGNFYRNGGSFTGLNGEYISGPQLVPNVITGNTYNGLTYARSYVTAGAFPDVVHNNNYPGIGHDNPLLFSGVTVLAGDQFLTFSTTVACSTALAGQTQYMADSTTAAWGAVIAGAGSNPVLALCDSTNWTVMGK